MRVAVAAAQGVGDRVPEASVHPIWDDGCSNVGARLILLTVAGCIQYFDPVRTWL